MGFWKEAKELFARFGNPGGGMVHKDLPDEKPASAPVEEVVKKSSSYANEVKELYAHFGNPGGGMIHKDLPEKSVTENSKKEEQNKVVAAAVAARVRGR